MEIDGFPLVGKSCMRLMSFAVFSWTILLSSRTHFREKAGLIAARRTQWRSFLVVPNAAVFKLTRVIEVRYLRGRFRTDIVQLFKILGVGEMNLARGDSDNWACLWY